MSSSHPAAFLAFPELVFAVMAWKSLRRGLLLVAIIAYNCHQV